MVSRQIGFCNRDGKMLLKKSDQSRGTSLTARAASDRDASSAIGGHLDRRTALSCLAAGLFWAGCDSQSSPETSPKSSSTRSDIPLRVLLVGSETLAETIKQAWAMSHEQPLKIEPTTLSELAEKCDQVDVVVMPQSFLGSAVGTSAIVDFNPSQIDSYEQQFGKQHYAVTDGLGSFGRQTWGVPVGGKLLAVLALQTDLELDSWANYHAWVKDLKGNASEPLAKGWAAASFLNRCSTSVSQGWLFDRTSMEPRINGDQYVAALEQLSKTAALYSNHDNSPAGIWAEIRRGKLRGGIGFSAPLANTESEAEGDEFEVAVFDCPLETETDRVWFPPQTPLACLSAGCRQTDASKDFIGWLSGGGQVNQVWNDSDLFCQTRLASSSETTQIAAAYTRWLNKRLTIRRVLPALIIPGAAEYYAALDQGIRTAIAGNAIAGNANAAETLNEVANQWEAITERYDRQAQAIAWKRSLGFSG